mmetsp:Transcript_3650/g.8653  ORF Transcript_3650/g.8653 Transcript_3650/m.8653 type:complete len:632 (-) Transcript_3650:397-2292(-)
MSIGPVLTWLLICTLHGNVVARGDGGSDVAFSMEKEKELEQTEAATTAPEEPAVKKGKRDVVFNWHTDTTWQVEKQNGDYKHHHHHERPRCHSIACKWHRIHPDVVRIRGHKKWHPIKRQLEDAEGNDTLPVGVALWMLANLGAIVIPLLLIYLWTKKSSKMLTSFRSMLHLTTLLVESELDGPTNTPYRKNGSKQMQDPNAEKISSQQIEYRGHLYAAICVVSILQGIEVAALAAFFPPAALKKGVSETMAGIIFAMRPCVQVILSPLAGKYIKLAKNRGIIMIGGMTFLACIYVLFGLVENTMSGYAFTFVCFTAALVQGTVDAMVNTAAFDIILALFGNEVVYRIAMKEVYETVGYLVGTPLGGVLYEAGGFMLPFIILGIGILLSSAGLYFITPNADTPTSPSSGEIDPILDDPLKFYTSILSRRTCVVLLTGTVLSGASYPFLETTLTLHAQQLQLNTSFTGVLFSICNGMLLLTMAAIGHGDRAGLNVGLVGFMGCAISFFLMGPTPVIPILPLNTSMLTISMVLCGVGTALAWLPMMNLLLVNLQRGSGTGHAANAAIAGVASVATSMGIVIGSLIGGFLADSFGFCWATTMWALVFILFFVVIQTENHALYKSHLPKSSSMNF